MILSSSLKSEDDMPVEIIDEIEETLAQKIATWLKINLPDNFEIIGDTNGDGIIGIIYADTYDLKVLGITLKKADRYYFGTIFTQRVGIAPAYEHTREASPIHWVFTVYGKENLETAKILADKMTENFKVSIKVILWSKEPQKQRPIDSGC
jgi:hypothetical protein